MPALVRVSTPALFTRGFGSLTPTNTCSMASYVSVFYYMPTMCAVSVWFVPSTENSPKKGGPGGGGGGEEEQNLDMSVHKGSTATHCQQSLRIDLCNLGINQGLTAGWGLAIVVAWLQRHICCGTSCMLPCITCIITIAIMMTIMVQKLASSL